MSTFKNDLLPMPISFLERNRLAQKLWTTVYDHCPCPVLQHCLRIDTRGTLKTRNLLSDEDSFYKCISLYVFGVDIFAYMIHKAVIKYAQMNSAELMDTYDNVQSFNKLSNTVFEHLKAEDRTENQASYIDVYVAAHLLQTPIVLLNQQKFEVCSQNGVWNDDGQTAILLEILPTGDGETYLFKPIVSYTRDLEASPYAVKTRQRLDRLDLSSSDLKYSITLLDRQGNNYVSIPYVIVRHLTTKLAEFCGDVVETKLSIEGLHRLKKYMLNQDQDLEYPLDHELYQFAGCWDILCLQDRIDGYVRQSSLAEVVNFGNHVSLWRHSKLIETMKKEMYKSCLGDLKKIQIHLKSDSHRSLNEFLSGLIVCKEGSFPLSVSYQLPEIVLSLDATNSSCTGKFYNGQTWCTLYIPDTIKLVIPYLKDNNYCVMRDTLYFIKDVSTLGEMRILNDYKGEITYTQIPQVGSRPRITTTNDPDILLLLSHETDRQIAEVRKNEDDNTIITPWRTIDQENFEFEFVLNECILYRIENYKCVLKADIAEQTNSLLSVDSIDSNVSSICSIHCYNIFTGKEFHREEQITGRCVYVNVIVPRRNSGPYVLLKTEVLVDHMKKCYRC